MASPIDNMKLQVVDDVYTGILTKKMSKSSFENRLGTLLSALPLASGEKNITATIVNQKHNEAFFGFRIFPNGAALDKLLQMSVDEKIGYRELLAKWKSIQDWDIEIDAMAIDRQLISFNPKELTAMTLHELGHVVSSERTFERFYRALQEAKARMKLADKQSIKVMYLLYAIPLAISCSMSDWLTPNKNIREEFFADKALLDAGYKTALVDALNKIIETFGSQVEEANDYLKDKQVSSSVQWATLNILDLTKRRNKLKDDLYVQSLRTDSKYMKALCYQIMNVLGVKMRERYTGAVVEQAQFMELTEKDEPAFEAVFDTYKKIGCFEQAILQRQESAALESFGKKKAPQLPSQYDIDVIGIEIDRIENNADRIYVLDLIYALEEKIDQFEEYISGDDSAIKKYESKIESMRKELAMFRKAVLARKIKSADYKLFVKYPAGYEG